MSSAEYYVHKDQKKTLKDKLKLFFCKYSVEGAVTFTVKDGFMDEHNPITTARNGKKPSMRIKVRIF